MRWYTGAQSQSPCQFTHYIDNWQRNPQIEGCEGWKPDTAPAQIIQVSEMTCKTPQVTPTYTRPLRGTIADGVGADADYAEGSRVET